ncbi:MAG TPA: exosortase E/protease, VPEID-CTERM system [Candidatus Xenobia bacterium]|jgi:exosortase E/protease (VPEID-CTERM system)
MLLLLFAECEYLIDPHYRIRTALHDAMLHLPLYHTLLGTIIFAVLLRLAFADQLPPFESAPTSRGWLLAHIGCFAFLNASLEPLYGFTSNSTGLTVVVWVPLIGFFLGAWLCSLLPPRMWLSTLKTHAGWLGACFVAGVVSLWMAQASDMLWGHMAKVTFSFSKWILSGFFDDVTSDPGNLVFGTSDFHLQVLPGCSGYEGMGLIAMFTVAYLWLRRNDLILWRAIWLLPAGMAIIWVANSIRLALLAGIGATISPQIAVRGFHSQAGWISFATIGIGMVLLAEKRRWFRKDGSEATQAEYPAAFLMLPLVVTLLARMVSMAFQDSPFDVYYPFRVLLVAAVLFHYRKVWLPLFGGVDWKYAIGMGVLVYVVWIAWVHGANDPAGDPTQVFEDPWAQIWIIFRIFGAAIIVPLVEELAFRGYLLRRFQSRYFEDVPIGKLTLVSVLGSSIVFGVMHSDWQAGILAGIAYAWCTKHKGRLGEAVAAHGITNLCLAIQVLLLHHWSLWS